MKKIIFISAACLVLSAVHAQDKLYVIPGAGIGISNVYQDFFALTPDENHQKTDIVSNYNTQILVGYHFKRWHIETGVQYLTTGFKRDVTFFSPLPEPDTLYEANGKMTSQYNHITIPVQVGFQIPLSPKFNIVPTLGANLGFNLSTKTTVQYPDGSKQTQKMMKEFFDHQYNKVSIWANAGVRMEYNLSNRFAIVGGPGFQYMVNNFLKKPTASVEYNASQRNYSLDFNLGLKVNLM